MLQEAGEPADEALAAANGSAEGPSSKQNGLVKAASRPGEAASLCSSLERACVASRPVATPHNWSETVR